MAAIRTTPGTKKCRTCMALIMSQRIGVRELSGGVSGHREEGFARNAGAALRAGVYTCAWAHLPSTNLPGFAPVVQGGPIRIFLLLALLSTVQPGVVDPRAGSWTLLSAQSNLDPPNRLSLTPTHGALHVVMSGENHLDFTANSNGQKSPAPGNLAFDHIELHRIDKRQSEVLEEKNGALIATVREKLSPDGSDSSPPRLPKVTPIRSRCGNERAERESPGTPSPASGRRT